MTSERAIEATGLEKSYGDLQVLDGFDVGRRPPPGAAPHQPHRTVRGRRRPPDGRREPAHARPPGRAARSRGPAPGGRALRRDPGRLTIGVATDGSAAQVRALLDEVDPARRAVDRFAVQHASLDDVYLALTGHPADRPEAEKESANV